MLFPNAAAFARIFIPYSSPAVFFFAPAAKSIILSRTRSAFDVKYVGITVAVEIVDKTRLS
jgi:hypothetical protein